MEKYGVKKVTLEELLKQSDIISICANLTEDNYHMLSEKEFEQMKKGVYISNTARGALINESALSSALASGKVKGFATDVLEVEPGRSNHPYLEYDNVVITPHISAYTEECLKLMGEKCVEDVNRVSQGLLPERSIQKETFLMNY